MIFWWCSEHEATQNGPDINYCWKRDWPEGTGVVVVGLCRMTRVEFVIEPSPAPYDIEIPDFVNRHGGW